MIAVYVVRILTNIHLPKRANADFAGCRFEVLLAYLLHPPLCLNSLEACSCPGQRRRPDGTNVQSVRSPPGIPLRSATRRRSTLNSRQVVFSNLTTI